MARLIDISVEMDARVTTDRPMAWRGYSLVHVIRSSNKRARFYMFESAPHSAGYGICSCPAAPVGQASTMRAPGTGASTGAGALADVPSARRCDRVFALSVEVRGPHLLVQPSGTRSWIQRLVVRGRRGELGFGSIPLVPLAEAREKAVANRKLARSGGDPLAEKCRIKATPTFAEAAAPVIDQKQAGWRNPAYTRHWRTSLERYAFPRIGRRPISEVTSADVLAILTPVWHTKPTLAKALRQRIHAVLEWAIAMNVRDDNPSDRVRPVLGSQRHIVTHMRALPQQQVAAALATVRASREKPALKLAFEFLVLTAVRSGEVRFAACDEIDTEARVWAIPAARMKMKRDHRVPLSGRAIEVLDPARALGDGPLVFPARTSRRLDCQAVAPAAGTLRHRLCSTRLPLVVPGLGGRGDGPSA